MGQQPAQLRRQETAAGAAREASGGGGADVDPPSGGGAAAQSRLASLSLGVGLCHVLLGFIGPVGFLL